MLTHAAVSCNEPLIAVRMKNFMKKYHVDGAAVLLASHGKIRTCLFGEAVPSKHIPVSENTLFELGSITKTFTGLILARQIIAGELHTFDESIQKELVPPYSRGLAKTTYLELATYTSGLPFNPERLAYNAAATVKNKKRLQHYLKRYVPAFQPGSHMFYSNVGFGILGQILASKKRVSLPDLLRDEILIPLKMNASGLDISNENQKYFAQGFTAKGVAVPYLSSGLFAGSWAMRASVNDMKYYLNAGLGEQATPLKIRQAMLLSQTAYYNMPSEETQIGLGWFITPLNKMSAIQKLIHQPAHYQFIPYKVKKIQKPTFNPNALIGKTGATDGFRAYIAVIPSKHTGIVIMINRFIPSSGALPNMANEILLEESHIPYKQKTGINNSAMRK